MRNFKIELVATICCSDKNCDATAVYRVKQDVGQEISSGKFADDAKRQFESEGWNYWTGFPTCPMH